MKLSCLNIYMLFIHELEPTSVLDAGMLMRSFAIVSRRTGDYRIDDDVTLTGLDLSPDERLPVEERLYDRILTCEGFDAEETEYDLTAFFPGTYMSSEDYRRGLIEKLLARSRYFLTGYENLSYLPPRIQSLAKKVTSDGDDYIFAVLR